MKRANGMGMSTRREAFQTLARIFGEAAETFRMLAELPTSQEAKAADADVYTSKNLPPGVSRRAFRERCALLQKKGDARVFRTSERCWCAKREAFDLPPRAPRHVQTGVATSTWTPEAAIAEALGRGPKGLRR